MYAGDEIPGTEPHRSRASRHDQRGGCRRQRNHRLPRVSHHDGQKDEGHRQVKNILLYGPNIQNR